MSRYDLRSQNVAAIYNPQIPDNPFLAAMPDMLSPSEFADQIRSAPALPSNLPVMSPAERRACLPLLSSLFVPMVYMYCIYDHLYRAIYTTYTTRTAIDSIRQTNALLSGQIVKSYATQADTGSILGVPGVGKTSTIRRCLATLPQVITHTEFKGETFFVKQILYLQVECPSDCSVKTLAFSILASLDRALGSGYLENLTSLRSSSASALATQIKILCMTHHVGVILVDEIQNAVETAQKNKQVRPLIKFLVELTNDTATSVYYVGTPGAEALFVSHEHLKRRTRGLRLLPLKPDGTYRKFLSELWRYQYTPKAAELSEKLVNKLYDFSGGIPAYIIKIFTESQAQALIQGASHITPQIMQRAIDVLAIKVPRTFVGGSSISDFQLGEEPEIDECDVNLAEVPRQYANKRGRKPSKREPSDLLIAYKGGTDMIRHLAAHDMLEVFQR